MKHFIALYVDVATSHKRNAITDMIMWPKNSIGMIYVSEGFKSGARGSNINLGAMMKM